MKTINDSAGGDGVDVGADVDANNDGVDLHLDHEVGRLAGLLPILLLLHSRHCSNDTLPSLFHLSKYFSRYHLHVVLSVPMGNSCSLSKKLLPSCQLWIFIV